MHRPGRRALRVTHRVVLVMCTAAAVLTIWGGVVWLACAREEVRLLDACMKAESASRDRLALVAHLVGETRSRAFANSVRVDELEAARLVAVAAALPVDDLTSDVRHNRWRDAQEAVTRQIERLWAALPTEVVVAGKLDDLRHRLEQAEERRARRAAVVEHSLGGYRAAAERFPLVLVATLVAGERRPGNAPLPAPR